MVYGFLSCGPFHDHGITDGHKHIGPNSVLFGGKSISCLWRRFPGGGEPLRRGTTCASLHKHTTGSDCLRRRQKKLKKKKLTKLMAHLKKHGAEQFSNNFYASVDVLICKFCQHLLDWIRADRPLALWNPCGKTNTALHTRTISNGKKKKKNRIQISKNWKDGIGFFF